MCPISPLLTLTHTTHSPSPPTHPPHHPHPTPTVIVKSSSGPRYVVGCRAGVERAKLAPGARVALDVTTLTIMRLLPREVDPQVYNMSQEDPGAVDYSAIGGLGEQVGVVGWLGLVGLLVGGCCLGGFGVRVVFVGAVGEMGAGRFARARSKPNKLAP